MPYFYFDDKKIFYDERGKGKPLLMLHGNTVSSSLFKTEFPYFANHFHAIVFDYPGHGKSERVSKFRDDFWRYNAECALALLDHLEIEHAYAVGTSGGAFVSLNMATMQPERLTRIIADSFMGERLTVEEAERIGKNRQAAKSQFMNQQYWKTHTGEDWEKIVDQDRDLLIRIAKQDLPKIYGDLSTIKAKVLGVATWGDELVDDMPDRVKEVCDQIPDARTKFFDHGRHTFMITAKEDFRRLALEFFLED